MKSINAFILAAGFGERLMPITKHIPKPLLPILGVPIIEKVLGKLTSLPLKRIFINSYYKSEMMSEWAQRSSYAGEMELIIEDTILGTGGAISNAASLLKKSCFLVHNADIISDLSLAELLERHLNSGYIATLAVHDHPALNNVWIDNTGKVVSVGEYRREMTQAFQTVAFTGIAVYSPHFLNFLPSGNSSVVDAWLKAAASGQTVGTIDFTGCSWNDIGTPQAYSRSVFDALRKDGESVYIHPSVDCSGVDIGGYSVIEQGSVISGSFSLRSSILLPGASLTCRNKIENEIVGPDYTITISNPSDPYTLTCPSSLLNGFSDNVPEKITAALVGSGGSDRNYYRITNGDKTAIIMECQRGDIDYYRHLEYTTFFRRHSIPVPILINWDPENMVALFEDLGDLSLYSWLKCRRKPEAIKIMYQRILDIMIQLHTEATSDIKECPLLNSRVFDYEHLRWETTYFFEKFVTNILRVASQEKQELETELDSLAKKVDAIRKTIVHRDFQSQNIMITAGDLPHIIDYQGARMGAPAYDIASFLWDPYFRIDDILRRRLLDYYMGKMHDYLGNSFDQSYFSQSVLPCRLQRHMQALGAYGFLSGEKGKTFFLKFIPQALGYLHEEAELAGSEYPCLRRVVGKLHEKIKC